MRLHAFYQAFSPARSQPGDFRQPLRLLGNNPQCISTKAIDDPLRQSGTDTGHDTRAQIALDTCRGNRRRPLVFPHLKLPAELRMGFPFPFDPQGFPFRYAGENAHHSDLSLVCA